MMRCDTLEKGRAVYKALVLYLMARVLKRAVVAKVSSNTIHCMERRVVRRLHKLCILDSEGMVTEGMSSGFPQSIFTVHHVYLKLIPVHRDSFVYHLHQTSRRRSHHFTQASMVCRS